jgi:hypothetical protein
MASPIPAHLIVSHEWNQATRDATTTRFILIATNEDIDEQRGQLDSFFDIICEQSAQNLLIYVMGTLWSQNHECDEIAEGIFQLDDGLRKLT